LRFKFTKLISFLKNFLHNFLEMLAILTKFALAPFSHAVSPSPPSTYLMDQISGNTLQQQPPFWPTAAGGHFSVKPAAVQPQKNVWCVCGLPALLLLFGQSIGFGGRLGLVATNKASKLSSQTPNPISEFPFIVSLVFS
jgi:hypothetical protein